MRHCTLIRMLYWPARLPRGQNTPSADGRRKGKKASSYWGAGGRNRTADTGIFSPLLYRLSYPGSRNGLYSTKTREACKTGPTGLSPFSESQRNRRRGLDRGSDRGVPHSGLMAPRSSGRPESAARKPRLPSGSHPGVPTSGPGSGPGSGRIRTEEGAHKGRPYQPVVKVITGIDFEGGR